MTKKKTINLAFQGGGSHGAVTWGVADRLLEDDRIEIEAISGSSAGAVNAAAVAYGLHMGGCDGARTMLDKIWKRISQAGETYSPIRPDAFPFSAATTNLVNAFSYQMFDTMTRAFSPAQFNPFDINPLRDILNETIDFDSLRQCKTTKLFIAATNVRSGKVHVFNTEDVSTDVIRASACLPFLFKPVEIDGESYWDGGYMGNPVLFPFFYEAKTSDIVIVHVNPIERDEVPATAPEIMNRINEISFNSSLLRELRAIHFVQKLLDNDWIKDEHRDRLRNIRVHSIRSDRPLEALDISSKFRTDWTFLTGLKQKGRDVADAWLSKNFDKIGKKSSVDLRAMFDSNERGGTGLNN
ncbi:patatin-like phospholipase family protein [Hyphococcus sp.]|uniref:patatin-like phospholipase family protein n=1 Tax=Hyphococcus sp. TaxID=2038636 RepID=UPI002082593F|nr:MAG: alpha/beta hydrolase [Marinicaulis sp.]